MQARALVAGPGAARALRAGGSGVVEIALPPGGYVRLGEHRLLVAAHRAPLGPLSLLACGLPRAGLRPGRPAALQAGGGAPVLVIGPLRIALDGVREAPPPRSEPCRPGWRPALDGALAACAAPPAELRPGLAALAEGRTDEAFRVLAGRGEGLTPAGDDVLAGWAAWRWTDDASAGAAATNALSADAAGRCAPLGEAYLACARRGELPDPAARVLEAVRRGDRRAAARGARLLTAWGSSSGAALLWGMAAAGGVHPAAPPGLVDRA
jgi:hypothetical protein